MSRRHHERYLRLANIASMNKNPYRDFKCKMDNYTQTLDHFGNINLTFPQKYYVCDDAFPKDEDKATAEGNIILFLGNEGPLDDPKQPIVFENAARKNALIIQVEHRYYGTSIPFTPNSTGMLSTDQYRWLTIENVIEDTKAVLESVKKEYNISQKVPVVVIGGSYGGQLATYHRLTHPETFQAAISASAPINYIIGTPEELKTEENFHLTISKAIDSITNSTTCSWQGRFGLETVLAAAGNSTRRQEIARELGLCNADTILADDTSLIALVTFLYDGFVGTVQLNNQVSYTGSIITVCNAIEAATAKDPGAILEGLAAAYRLYNSSKHEDCIDFDPSYIALGNPSSDPSMGSYSYQCCVQGTSNSGLFSSTGQNGTILPRLDITDELIARECSKAYGIDIPPRLPPDAALNVQEKLKKIGNVVFTNGNFDAWSAGSLTSNISGVRINTIIYENASHCTDTHSFNWHNVAEPPEYKQLRADAIDSASQWMEEYRNMSMKMQRPASSSSSPYMFLMPTILMYSCVLIYTFMSSFVLGY